MVMNTTREQEADFGDLLRLWICRIFAPANALRSLVRETSFGDCDVACALGLSDENGAMANGYNQDTAQHAFRCLHAELESRSEQILAPPYCRANLQKFGRLLQLSQTEQHILLLVTMIASEPNLRDAFALLCRQRKYEHLATVARVLKLPLTEVRVALSGAGRLMRSGLISWGTNRRHADCIGMVYDEIGEVLLSEVFSVQTALRAIVSLAPPPSLAYRDYPHLRSTLGYLRRYLGKVMRDRPAGVNIYLHGIPGTGKSELARVLARELRAPLYEISTENKDGDPKPGEGRLQSLRLAQSLLSGQRALLVFDEAEDVFAESMFRRSVAANRKGWMNRMLEGNSVPVIWIANSKAGMDPAFIRRFDFVFEVPPPPRGQRLRTFRRICANQVRAPILARLAGCEGLAPAVVARAHAVIDRMCTGQSPAAREQALLHLVGHTLRAQGHFPDALEQAAGPIPKVYDLDFLNSDRPLAEIADRLHPQASCRICLYGPPGTGKTTFGHWLARKLELPLHVKRASDILSPYVGETEQQIARVFRDALEDKAILMIDEVDSFLRDRRTAERSWEVTQVNELLTQMERFEGIFIASTNLVDGIDPASLRRFDLKVAFDFLRAAQACRLFARICRSLGLRGPAPEQLAEIGRLDNLTPGDFANVSRQHRFRKFANPQALLQAVCEECRMKEGGNRRRVGF